MGLPGEDAAAAPAVATPFLCVLRVPAVHPNPHFLQLRISAGECPAPTRAAVVQIHPGLPIFMRWTASIKVMPAALNGKNGERYPGGLPVSLLP